MLLAFLKNLILLSIDIFLKMTSIISYIQKRINHKRIWKNIMCLNFWDLMPEINIIYSQTNILIIVIIITTVFHCTLWPSSGIWQSR